MKSKRTALLPSVVLSLVTCLMPIAAQAQQLIPAGSLIGCTVSEPRLSSKTADVGDPVLCQVSHVEVYGRSVLPYGSYLVGRFEDYKDPGHFVGKGWMELKFDRMVVPPDQVIPVAAKVVYVPNYPVDKLGRIHGKGHPVRDTVEWMIPVLWPIDLLTLPIRGPRPVLKAETRLTLKIMDDFGVPTRQAALPLPYPAYNAPPAGPYGFSQRTPMSSPLSYSRPVAPAPQPYQAMAAPYPVPVPVPVPAPAFVVPAPRPLVPPTVLMLRDGNRRMISSYWFDGEHNSLRFVSLSGAPVTVPLDYLDLPSTVEANRQRGVVFTMRSGGE